LAIAKALREWLLRVIQAIEPWMSDSDADKGIRWEQRIGQELEETRFGIFCLTPENLDSRWLNFEAGAIAKTVDKTYVCTLAEIEAEYVSEILTATKGNKTEAARRLGISRKNLYERIARPHLGEQVMAEVNDEEDKLKDNLAE